MARTNSWRLADGDGRELSAALILTVAPFLDSFVPGAMWLGKYLFDRRDLIFDRRGRPARAYDSTGQALNLANLGSRPGLRQGTLSLGTGLTASARQLGLRNGDPVSYVIAGQRNSGAENGLVIPARVGDRIDVAVPQGAYSLAAFASRGDALFTMSDPFSAVSGAGVVLGGRSTLDMPLAVRNPVTGDQPRYWIPRPGCNCEQCSQAANQRPAAQPQFWTPKPGCNCEQCRQAANQTPAAQPQFWTPKPGCNCEQCVQFRNGY